MIYFAFNCNNEGILWSKEHESKRGEMYERASGLFITFR